MRTCLSCIGLVIMILVPVAVSESCLPLHGVLTSVPFATLPPICSTPLGGLPNITGNRFSATLAGNRLTIYFQVESEPSDVPHPTYDWDNWIDLQLSDLQEHVVPYFESKNCAPMHEPLSPASGYIMPTLTDITQCSCSPYTITNVTAEYNISGIGLSLTNCPGQPYAQINLNYTVSNVTVVNVYGPSYANSLLPEATYTQPAGALKLSLGISNWTWNNDSYWDGRRYLSANITSGFGTLAKSSYDLNAEYNFSSIVTNVAIADHRAKIIWDAAVLLDGIPSITLYNWTADIAPWTCIDLINNTITGEPTSYIYYPLPFCQPQTGTVNPGFSEFSSIVYDPSLVVLWNPPSPASSSQNIGWIAAPVIIGLLVTAVILAFIFVPRLRRILQPFYQRNHANGFEQSLR